MTSISHFGFSCFKYTKMPIKPSEVKWMYDYWCTRFYSIWNMINDQLWSETFWTNQILNLPTLLIANKIMSNHISVHLWLNTEVSRAVSYSKDKILFRLVSYWETFYHCHKMRFS